MQLKPLIRFVFLFISLPLWFSCTESKGNQDSVETVQSLQNSEAVKNMVLVPGGTLNTIVPYTETKTSHVLKSFYIDTSPVTVAEFKKFAKLKSYKTDAEKFGNSPIFDIKQQGWAMADSVSYLFPLGKKNGYVASDDHPATQISWQDAKYYALMDGVEPGTIVRVVNPTNSKAVYAKVLGAMSGISQNKGLDVRISNAAANVLDVTDTEKFVVKVDY